MSPLGRHKRRVFYAGNYDNTQVRFEYEQEYEHGCIYKLVWLRLKRTKVSDELYDCYLEDGSYFDRMSIVEILDNDAFVVRNIRS
jgi:hypothetical protein